MNTHTFANIRSLQPSVHWLHSSSPRVPLLLILPLVGLLALAGCVTESPDPPPRVRLGMTHDDLRFFFGEPLRTEKLETGEEVWFYRVIFPTGPQIDGAVWEGPYEGSGGVALSVAPTPKVREECPVFLSAEGRVIEPLPQVYIRGR